MAELTLRKEMSLGSIEIKNYDELKEYAEKVHKKYATLVISENEIDVAKKERAAINAAAKDFNAKRLAYQKEFLKPFDEVKAKIDNLISLFKEASENLDTQIKIYEDKSAQEKITSIKVIFDKLIEEQKLNLVSFEGIYNEKWINKGMTEKKIQAEILDRLSTIKSDLYIINQTYTNQSDKDDIQLEYYALVNGGESNCLSQAIKKFNDRLAMQKNLQESKQDDPEQDGVFTIRYVISGNKEQLNQVSQFLRDHKITYRVER